MAILTHTAPHVKACSRLLLEGAAKNQYERLERCTICELLGALSLDGDQKDDFPLLEVHKKTLIHIIMENRNRRASGPVHFYPSIPLHACKSSFKDRLK